MYAKWIRAGLCIVALSLFANRPSLATPTAVVTTMDLGMGLFEYNIIINNAGGPEPLQGLLLFNANTLFGLDGSSVIGAPQDVGGNLAADWDFFPPEPPVVDQLSYFSLLPAGDIPIGGILGGFTFQSARDPQTVRLQDFDIDAVGSDTGGDIDIDVVVVPEPSTLILFGMGTLSLLGYAWQRRKKAA